MPPEWSSSSLDRDPSLPPSFSSEEGTGGKSPSLGSSLMGVLDLEYDGVGALGGRGRDFTAVILLSLIL